MSSRARNNFPNTILSANAPTRTCKRPRRATIIYNPNLTDNSIEELIPRMVISGRKSSSMTFEKTKRYRNSQATAKMNGTPHRGRARSSLNARVGANRTRRRHLHSRPTGSGNRGIVAWQRSPASACVIISSCRRPSVAASARSKPSGSTLRSEFRCRLGREALVGQQESHWNQGFSVPRSFRLALGVSRASRGAHECGNRGRQVAENSDRAGQARA